MARVLLRFYEELNDFLPKPRQKTDFTVDFRPKRSIKDLIEALGVPHTEIDLILINGKSLDFSYQVQDGDRVSVYPVFESLNIKDVTRLRKIPLRQTTFIADVNLGDLVKCLRIIGYDVSFSPKFTPREIIAISKNEKRIILTKSRKLLKFKDVTHGIFIRPGTTREKIKRLIEFLDIKEMVKPFSRCLRCNTLLKPIAKEKILERIPPKTRDFCQDYSVCETCDKIYWKGTHYIKMKKVVEKIL